MEYLGERAGEVAWGIKGFTTLAEDHLVSSILLRLLTPTLTSIPGNLVFSSDLHLHCSLHKLEHKHAHFIIIYVVENDAIPLINKHGDIVTLH